MQDTPWPRRSLAAQASGASLRALATALVHLYPRNASFELAADTELWGYPHWQRVAIIFLQTAPHPKGPLS